MIKLDRLGPPSELTQDEVVRLTALYLEDGKPVWNRQDIKQRLLESSNKKCAYCEAELASAASYMEVEHYEDKKRSPEKVVHWPNLLPSCKRCNCKKGEHDVRSEPIVNPYDVDPRQHLRFSLYRFFGFDRLGSSTIEVLDLNDSERLVWARFQVGEAIHEYLKNCADLLERYVEDQSTRRRNRFLNLLRRLLLECQQASAYAASSAAVLHEGNEYSDLRQRASDLGLWNDELEELHENSLANALPGL